MDKEDKNNDLHKIRRFNFRQCYDIPKEKTKLDSNESLELVNEYYDSSKMRWFRNQVNILPTTEQTVKTKLEIMKHNQQFESSFVNTYQEFISKNRYVNHLYPNVIIQRIGGDINNLNNKILYKDVKKGVLELKSFLEQHKVSMYRCYDLRRIPSDMNNLEIPEIIRFCNKVLHHQYGIKLKKTSYSNDMDKIKYKLIDDGVWNNLGKTPLSIVRTLEKKRLRSNNQVDSNQLDDFIEDSCSDTDSD